LEYNDHYVHVLSKTVASDGTQNTQLNQCQDRTDPTYVNWGYHLFAKADGTAVSINTGFPFKHNGQFGWVGYWGVSYEDTGDIVGETITRLQDGSSEGGQTYTLDESASGSNTDSGVSFGLWDSNGDLVDFQAPRALTYTVQVEDEINADPNHLAGTKIDLAYSGGDQLTFPTMTNYDWSAGTAQLNLKAGTVVKGDSGKEFVLKPTDQAITLGPVSNCTDVDGQAAIDNLSLPTSELLKAVGLSWSDKPSTPDTPSVIEGKLQ
jgi:hypothetical protein